MKHSRDNRVVTVVFICENDGEAQRVVNEVTAMATQRGCNLITFDVDAPDDDHEKMADELGLYE